MKSDWAPVPEAKRIENAENRKLVLGFLGTSAALTLLLILNALWPNPAVRWIMFSTLLPAGYLFYRLAQKTRKLKSVLPPEMEAKRIRIGKRHNLLVLALLPAVGLLPLGTIWMGAAVLHAHTNSILCLALALTVLTVGYGIYRIIQHDNALCRQFGYMCPYCHQPLYEPHATTYLNGLCPKCKKSVLAENQRSASAGICVVR
jgi:hypothetical protein